MAGYGYQEREPSLQVNWAEVGSNINAVLKEESRVREEKKAAIDEATRNYQKVLSEGVRGESKTLNEAAIQFSADAQEQMLMQERLLKSGSLSPKDYAVMRQNLTDGTDAAFSLMQEYQDVYAEKMQRIKDGKAQDLEAWMMSNVEGFANFSKAGLVINPENGKVNAAYRVKDPKTGEMVLSSNPNDLVDVGALRGQIAGYYDNYDLEGATAKWASETGVWKTAAKVVDGTRTRNAEIDSWMNPFAKVHTKEELMKLGLSEEEAETMNYYFRAEDDWITGQMSNPYNMSSVLTNFVNTTAEGAEYTFTYDVEKAKTDPNLILLGDDNLPVFDPKVNPNAAEQEKQVRAFMKMSIRNKMDVTQDKQSFNEYRNPNPPAQWQVARGDKDKEDKNKLGIVAKLWYGNDSEVAEATDWLRRASAGYPDNRRIVSLKRDSNGVTVIYADGTSDPAPFKDASGNIMAQSDWAVGAAPMFFTNDDLPRDMSKKWTDLNLQDREFNATSTASSVGEVKKEETANEAFARILREDKSLSTNLFVKNNDVQTKKNLTNLLNNYGIKPDSITTEGYFGTDEVKIVIGGNEYVFNLDDDTPFQKYLTTIKTIIDAKADKEKLTAGRTKTNIRKGDAGTSGGTAR